MNPIARTARVVTAAIMIVTSAGAWVQAQNKAARTPAGKNMPGSGKLTAGFITGSNWMITYQHMNPNWVPDTDLANQTGLQEIFHPENWNPRWMSPSIQVGFSEKDAGVTIPAEVARDAKNLRKQIPGCKITPGPALVMTGGKRAAVQIFTYKNGWDKTVYSDGGKVIFLTTLHCESEAQCRRFEPMFENVARSLTYLGNIKVMDRTKSN